MYWPDISSRAAMVGLVLLLTGMLSIGVCAAAEKKDQAPAHTVESDPKKVNKKTDEANKKGKDTKLEDVVVSERPADQVVGETFTGIDATSGTILTNELITDRIYVTPLDMLKLVPGVTVLNFKSGGLPLAVQMRGFPFGSHSSSLAIYLDGIDLYDVCADTNQIIPEEIEKVEVIKGPASALYGNHASAGSVHFHTYQKGDFTRLKLQYGSYNTQEGVAVVARSGEKLDQVYAGKIYHMDGYRDHSKWDKQIGAGRWTYHATDRLDANFNVRVYHTTWDDAGTIPQAWYDENPKRALNDVNGGWKERGQVQGGLKYKLTDSSKLTWMAFAIDQDWGRWRQNYTSKELQPGDTNGSTYRFRNQALGTTLAYNFEGELWSRKGRLDLGVEWRKDNGTREYWNLMEGYGRTKGAKTTDDDVEFFTTSFYGEFSYQILKQFRVILGSRYDMFTGTLDRMDGSSYDNDGPRIYSPKAGVIYSPFAYLDLYANYGKGFALPSTVNYSTRDYLEPAIRTQYEFGLRARPTTWSDLSLAFWRLDTTDDFQTSPTNPDLQVNAGETRREGIEFSANARFWKHLSLRLNYAYTNSEYLNYYTGGVHYDGNELRYTPHHIFNIELSWQPPDKGWGGRINYRYQSAGYIDYANTLEMDGFEVVNAQVSYRFNKRYRLGLDVINLLDNKYSEYVGTSSGVKVYSPADPLSFYLTLSIDW